MNQRRTSSAYFEGVEEFLDFAFANASVDGEIICPCNVCGNSIWVSRIGARGHLICNGFIKGYTKWVAHGEVKSSAAPLSRAHVALDVIDDMRGLLHDRFHMSSDEVREGATDVAMEGPNGEAEKFYKLLQDSQEMLYKDCKNFSRLSFLVWLLHIKSLGLGYEKIDACPNDCMLYWKENATKMECDVLELYLAGDERISEELRILARGPNEVVTRYKGFIINGFRFHIKELEQNRKTQNSGLVVNAMTPSFSSTRDDNPILGDLTYYGVLEEIIELQYLGSKRVVLFRSNWVSKGSRKKEDENGFTLLNFKRLTRHKEPFVLASQLLLKMMSRHICNLNHVMPKNMIEMRMLVGLERVARSSGENMIEQSNVQTDPLQFDGINSGKSNPATAELGHEPSWMDMFIECHSKKDENRTPSIVEATNYMAQMHENREKLSEGSQDLPAENDILSQVVGKDKYGRVRMYGLGVSQSDVWDQIPSRKQSQRIAME
ncbi:hypothetical protein RJ639_027704 [Escallonia herrerae]|uniref:Transposase-associated domain-containing protein n=1 Tax=Escallonia herrerae TaxID=1293975 RepID=A0AA88XIP4_9ASTE|nr:hypothetical protein RJ639_027704 [Escallonia herrerae]